MADEVEVEYRAWRWPRAIFTYWLVFLGIFSVIVLSVYAQFIAVQNALDRPQPWYFQMSLAVAVITIVCIGAILMLFQIRMVTPFFMLAFGLIGFVLWLVALIGTSLALFSNQNNEANDYCHDAGILWTAPTTIATTGPVGPPPVVTTAQVLVFAPQAQLSTFLWHQLCGAWKAAFVFQMFTILLFVYIIYLSFEVLQADRKEMEEEIVDVEVLPLLQALHRQAVTPFSLLQCILLSWLATRLFEFLLWQRFDCGVYSPLPWDESECAGSAQAVDEWRAMRGYTTFVGLAVFVVSGLVRR
ncbi:hypothetical protein Dda_4685 [Drechslerella dactyloides]|uniref:Uncharacterized protein n=1 Tax=Drechslerella dactyloides TaxID=74499 RepID=A0AAD6IXD5_DREDA|nr:hypothetical protein Dda_4685 [Drechslerella dactyloides]